MANFPNFNLEYLVIETDEYAIDDLEKNDAASVRCVHG